MQKSGDNVPCPHKNRIRISDLLFVSTLLLVTETTRSALSLRITVLVELRLCLLICSTERKTGLQQHHVKMCKYGICMEYGRFGSIPYIKSFIPYHSMPWSRSPTPASLLCCTTTTHRSGVFNHVSGFRKQTSLNFSTAPDLSRKNILFHRSSALRSPHWGHQGDVRQLDSNESDD